MPWAFLL
jgi:hypothetical protein